MDIWDRFEDTVKVSFLHPNTKPARRKLVVRLKKISMQAGAVDEMEANIDLLIFNEEEYTLMGL